MQTLDFGGSRELIGILDDAAARGDTAQITGAVEQGLRELIRAGVIDLPESAQIPGPTTYGRRMLYRSDRFGYTVIAMAWGVRQGTPLHDHAGLWCVEGVWKGRLEVVQYELLEFQGERYRFTQQDVITAGHGSAGSLIPPFEYHTLSNLQPDAASISLHVYGGHMDHCCIFEPQGGGWYLRRTKRLLFDD